MAKIIVILTFIVLANPASGQQTVQELSKENSRLRSEIRQLEKMLQKAEEAGFYHSERGYSSALEILKELPRALQVPTRGNWSSFDFEKVQKEMALAVGKPFAIKHRVSVTTRHTGGGNFNITCKFQQVRFPHRGKLFQQWFATYEYSGDEQQAKNAQKLDGKTIKIDGILTACSMKGHGRGGDYNIYFQGTQCRYSPPLDSK